MISKYLLDASAVYPLVLKLRENVLNYIDRFVVLDLTIYEVGNVIWKEFRRGRIANLRAVTRLFEELFSNIAVLRLETRLHEVLELAIRENLTFYDASYLYTARSYGMKIVTEDSDLLKFPEAMNVDQLVRDLQTS